MDDYRNLQYFFIAYSVMLLVICSVFAFLVARVQKLRADLDELRRGPGGVPDGDGAD